MDGWQVEVSGSVSVGGGSLLALGATPWPDARIHQPLGLLRFFVAANRSFASVWRHLLETCFLLSSPLFGHLIPWAHLI